MAVIGLKVCCLAFTGTAVSPWDAEGKVNPGKTQAGKPVSEGRCPNQRGGGVLCLLLEVVEEEMKMLGPQVCLKMVQSAVSERRSDIKEALVFA